MPLIPWLRGDRAAVLSALALAMGAREPLPEALAALAAEDPLLRPWAARLAPALRAGAALPALLRRTRALDRDEAAELAAAGDPARTLGRLAAGSGRPPRGYLFVRWYPAWMATWLILLLCLGDWLRWGDLPKDLFASGFRSPRFLLPFTHAGADGWWWLLLLWAGTHAIAWTPGVRHLLHSWSPDVHRTAAWWRLVRWARLGVIDQRPSPWTRDTPRRTWSTWWLLSRWRLPVRSRRNIGRLPMSMRLHALGAPRIAADGLPDWERTEREALERFHAAVDASWVRASGPAQGMLLAGWVLAALFVSLFSVFAG